MAKIVIKPRHASEPEERQDTSDEDNEEIIAGDSSPGNISENENDDQEEEEGSDEGPADSSPAPEPEPAPVPVKRGRGRPRGSGRGGSRASAVGTPEGGTPRPRGRPRGRGRGRGRGGLTIRLPKRDGDEDGEEGGTDAEGGPFGGKPTIKIRDEVYEVDGDELVTPNDPKGEEKIDEWGNLLGGRQFKSNTFILPNRHEQRKYMLAIDAARSSGFRDSLYYFRRNPLALKLNATQPEKDHLIADGKLGSHFRTRNVTLVTARSAFKLHGSKMLVDGRWVVDDYYEEKVLAEIAEKGVKAGDLVGDLPDPNAQSSAADNLAAAGARNERNAQPGMGLYRAGGPTTIFGGYGWGPYSDGPLNAVRKSLLTRDGLTEENWMFKTAEKVLDSSQEWNAWRRESLQPGGYHDEERRKVSVTEAGGIYEPHTGLIHYRSDTQPTKSRLEQINDTPVILGGSKAGQHAWGIAYLDTVMETNTASPEAQARARLMASVRPDEVPMIIDP